MKQIGLASDHAGFELKQYVKQWLEAKGWEYKDFGTYSTDSCDYPDYAHPLARAVEAGECYPGIAICGSGEGINITLDSTVAYQFGEQIKRVIAETAHSLGLNDARIEAIDKGALDCTVRARTAAAIERATGLSLFEG